MDPIYRRVMAWCADETIAFFGAVCKAFEGFSFSQEGRAEESAAEFILDKAVNYDTYVGLGSNLRILRGV